ncbi:MAG: HAD-IIA family hydrolase [Brevefilum sp.]
MDGSLENKIEHLQNIKCFLMDMDGTIYLGDQLLPGARDWLKTLETHQIPYYFLTNNSSRSRVEYAQKLGELGLEVPEEKIFTSGEATAIYLKNAHPNASLFVVGTPPLREEFARNGFRQTEEDPDVAVLGFDTTLTYNKLWKLCDLVVAGKPYIATHPDINCPTPEGFKPDIGAVIELVATSTGRRPDVIVGKPYAPIVEALAEKTGFPIDAHCMIGDRLYTDIALGRWGITTALVLSGETQADDLKGSDFQPDFVVRDIAAMDALMQQALDQKG